MDFKKALGGFGILTFFTVLIFICVISWSVISTNPIKEPIELTKMTDQELSEIYCQGTIDVVGLIGIDMTGIETPEQFNNALQTFFIDLDLKSPEMALESVCMFINSINSNIDLDEAQTNVFVENLIKGGFDSFSKSFEEMGFGKLTVGDFHVTTHGTIKITLK